MAASFRTEGSVGAIAGGLLLVAGHLLNYVGNLPAGTTVGKGAVFFGHSVLVFAFVGLYNHQHRESPAPLGRVGMLLGVFGTVLVSAIVFVELAGTTGVDTAPVFAATGTTLLHTLGPLVFVLGMLLVGASILRRDDIPRIVGGLLAVGTVVFATASVVPDLAAAITVVGAAVTAAGFVWLGLALHGADGSGRGEV